MLKNFRDILMNVRALLLVKNLSLICMENLLHSLFSRVLYTMNYRNIIEFQNLLLIHSDIYQSLLSAKNSQFWIYVLDMVRYSSNQAIMKLQNSSSNHFLNMRHFLSFQPFCILKKLSPHMLYQGSYLILLMYILLFPDHYIFIDFNNYGFLFEANHL